MNIGDKWNNWTVTEVIGEGSFGTVYKIERQEFGYNYCSALKVIRIPQNNAEVTIAKNEGMPDDSINTYFLSMVEDIVSEFAIMSKLRGNSNVVSYEDHSVKKLDDSFGWEIYIRMELLEPLFDYLNHNTLTIRDVIRLGIDMCRAIELCQKYNIIHRDIKPENIFVSDQGSFKLGDFGIARQLEKTSSGMSKKGTYSYMAPEVYKGQAYNSTVDIYSLGIVLYRFLNNNRTPFLPPYPTPIKYSDKENANILRMSGERIKPPCNAKGRLAEIVLKACSYDPQNRYESAVEMREALESIAYTEEESKIIYPAGDVLSQMEKSSVAPDENSVKGTGDNTVSMFNSAFDGQRPDLANGENTWEPEKSYSIKRSINELESGFVESSDSDTVISDNCDERTEVDSIIKSNNESCESTFVSNRRNSKRFLWIIGFCVLLLCCFIPFMLGQLHHVVPSLVGVDEAQVKDLLEKEDLVLDGEKYIYSESVEKGIVISQSIQAGTSVKKGTQVDIVVSKGNPIIVPQLIGLDKKKAIEVATGKSLTVTEESSAFSSKIKKGSVLKQNPSAGEKLAKGDSIKVVLSKGPEKVEVPNVKGKSTKKAKETIKSAGLRIVVKKEYSDSVSEGTVISQSKKAGSKVNKHSSITIVVSIGPKPDTLEPDYNDSVDNSNNYHRDNSKSIDDDVVDI